MMPVHWRGQGSRPQGMLHKSEMIPGFVPIDEKTGVNASQEYELTITRTNHSWSGHGALPFLPQNVNRQKPGSTN